MSVAESPQLSSHTSLPEVSLATPTDRRAAVDARQAWVAELLKSTGCDGLLILQPENFAWLSAGAVARGTVDADMLPALYFSADSRWLVSANVDSQRLFDEELDGLGFQLKEWPWHWGRAQLLADLCQGRNVASDVALGECKFLGEPLQKQRRAMDHYEQACLRTLGQIVSHALEATGRTLVKGDSEREAAGQLVHRLMHRGALPVEVTVFADGRSRLYRQGGFTSTPIQRFAVLSTTARKYGLNVRASRTISFGPLDDAYRKDHDGACKVSAHYIASTWPDSVPKQILAGGLRIYQIVGAEHEWAASPQGYVTGRASVETLFYPRTEELLQNHWAVTWLASVGVGFSCDTFLITEDGPRAVTAAENWPLKRIRIQGAEFVRPDVLVR